MPDPVVLTDDHARCERLRMCLAEAGLDPDRVMCREQFDVLYGPWASVMEANDA